MSLLTKAQDKFFKAVFSRKEIVTELFEKTISDEILPLLNLNGLELVSGSFVDGKLKEHFADLVYKCPLTDKGEVQIVLLLEHKSYQEVFPHFQLLLYFLGLWNQHVKQQEKPAFIIPIVFYHGKATWHYQRMQDYFSDIPTPLLRYLPMFDYDLIDLSAMQDHQIEDFRNGFLAVSTFLLKHRHQQNYIKLLENQFVSLMKRVEIQEDEELTESIFVYIQATNNLPTNELISIFGKISAQSKELTMSTLERVFKQGRDEATYEAIKNLLKEGLITDVERLRSVFKLSKKKMEEFLKRIQSEK